MFWDGRATGWVTGDPLADQAMGPFLNPVEQNMPSEEAVCETVAASGYAVLYEQVYGELDCRLYDGDHLKAFKNFALAIAAFERSAEVSAYSSKYDDVIAGADSFTAQERRGRQLFNGKAMCSTCHPEPLFTDFTYANIGVPKNPDNPFYDMDEVYLDDGSAINPLGDAWVDPGLAGFLSTLSPWPWNSDIISQPSAVDENYGKHKIPTLRNVDKRPGLAFDKAYMHNGSLKSLEEVIEFLNDRDAMIASGDLVPEVSENIAIIVGSLNLTDGEKSALVAFLKTLSDDSGGNLP